MNKRVFTLLIFSFTWAIASAQNGPGDNGTISGRIIDSRTHDGVEGAFVFFAHTTRGAQTNKHGFFTVRRTSDGVSEIVVAKAGYQPEIRIYEPESDEKKLEIRLAKIPKGDNLRMQTAHEKRLRQFLLEKFKHIFLGVSETGSLCKIKNEKALDFFYNEKTNVLEAYANAPLLIENRFTGYRIVFVLENFTCFSLEGKIRYTYKGHTFFMEMVPQLDGNPGNWWKNRYTVYRGSLLHFLSALSKSGFAEAGYEISLATFSPTSNAILPTEVNIGRSTILRPVEKNNRYMLKFPDFLQVDYLDGDNLQTSWLFLNRNYAIFDHTGKFIKPFNPVTVHGDWANQSFSVLLPRDYIPRSINTLGYNK